MAWRQRQKYLIILFQLTWFLCSWSHISLSMFGQSFGCKAKYDLFYAVIPTHTSPVASIIIVIVIDIDTNTRKCHWYWYCHHIIEFSRVEMRSILVSFLPSANTLTTILTPVLFLAQFPHIVIYCFFLPPFCFPLVWGSLVVCDARPYWISHGRA